MTTDTAPPPAIVEPAQGAPVAASEPPTAQNDQLRKDLEDSRKTLESLRRERQITRALFEAGAVDLDVGVVLIERELATHPNADPMALVGELRKRKPLMFKRFVSPPMGPTATSRPLASAMIGRQAGADDPRSAAADRARSTGSRGSLLDYMRLRRQPAD